MLYELHLGSFTGVVRNVSPKHASGARNLQILPVTILRIAKSPIFGPLSFRQRLFQVRARYGRLLPSCHTSGISAGGRESAPGSHVSFHGMCVWVCVCVRVWWVWVWVCVSCKYSLYR